MTQTFTVADVIPATPAAIYAAWLDSVAHAAMTGGGKAEASPEVGAGHSAWDGYINGINLALEPVARIVQSWRSTDFMPDDADSTLTVLLEPAEGGTKVTLLHADVPDHQADFADGWRAYYLEPMKAYFAALGIPVMAPEPPAAEPPMTEVPAKMARPKKAPAQEPLAMKAPARKPAAKKTVAAKAPAKKPAAKKVGKKAAKPAAKKPTARKTAAKKAPTRKAAAKKPVVRKTAAKKAPTRKAAAKKLVGRKTAAKKAPARKAAAKKPAAKRRTTSKAGRKGRR